MVAIVYVGNAVVDTTHTKNIIEKACRYTHVDKQKLAETLLSEMSDKVIDIAFECGFNNISYFNRTFKAEYGVSPSTYAALKKK